MNQQSIEKREHRTDGFVQVHSIFHTIQGEGPFCGTPAVFVRLSGCNLQCPACDTDYTSHRALMSANSVVELVEEQMPRGLVVITGGEPFRQNLSRLLHALVEADYYVQIETNGSLEPTPFNYTLDPGVRHGVYVVCSPKTGKMNPGVLDVACALKYVVEHENIDTDGLPLQALQHTANPRVARPPTGWSRPIYIQPMDEHDEGMNLLHQAAAVESCLQHGYIFQLQIHKIIGVD